MSTRRPADWPLYGDPVRCPIRGGRCDRFDCVMSGGHVCQGRDALALVPKDMECDNRGDLDVFGGQLKAGS